MDVRPLTRASLAEAQQVLAAACAFDRADAVADEKLFGAGPTGAPTTFGAFEAGELVGVAVIAARWVRVVAVMPKARGRGVGSALLSACEAVASSESRLVALAQPGNYLAPGIDERNAETIAWLERRGYSRGSELRTNLLVAVRNNARVTAATRDAAIEAVSERGYEVKRATADAALTAAIASEFGGAWPFEVERALQVGGAHVATRDGAYCAFAAHDGNNQGLGWFGPTATWPAHRGQGLGEALLLACLVDVAEHHATCEIAWIGPRPFYERVAGVVGERRFVPMAKSR